MTKELNDSLDNLFGGDTGPVRTEAAIERPAAQEYVAKVTAPGYVQKCAKCYGSGQTRWGVCYSCKGAGGRTFKTSPEARAQAATQRVERKERIQQEGVEAWQAANPEAYAWLEKTAPRWELAASLLAGLQKWGSLTEKQMAIVTKGIARDAERAAGFAARAEAAPTVDTAGIDRLKAAFDKAIAYTAEKGLKLSPRMTVGSFIISPAKADSKNPGALYVKSSSTREYLGKVQNGRFFASMACDADQKAKVAEFISDPAQAAKVYGQTTGTCCICNATLRSEWKNRGIGPVCAEKFGW